jgi:Protein of unknown function (DUF4031)/Bifunctional DNA primase/polymerase, N-terminal
MAVYVDDLNVRTDVPDGATVVRGRWSYLFADTEDELRAFATKIGLKETWIQHPGQPHVHFDVVGRLRQRAIAAGAQPVTWRQAGEFFAERARRALTPVDEPVTSLLLVSGPREGVTRETVQAALAPKFATTTLLVTGAAKGVDTYAAELWREWGGLVEEHPVPAEEQERNPRGAGHARNVRMVHRVTTAGGSVLVIDLPCTRPSCPRPLPHNTHGTSGCAALAERAGLPVEHYQAPTANSDGLRPGHGSRAPAEGDTGGDGDRGTARGRALRQATHLYLGHGLLPVPGWAANANGACCCPRGAACPRPGKHPRAVHVGPGPHDYSWKPLACHTHDEAEQRFADGGEYADGNLMLAIPPGMLVIDQDDDDGGPQAIATLAAQLGELPATLAHPTPHGVHRIYRTPPGWTGRAWVGKDTHNPLPAGIDLRVPGQILMAAPSQVPIPGGLAAYGLPTGAGAADLPAAYLAAWTPPQPPATRPRRPVPVPPDRADAAASYVHARVDGITADLAAHEPGGRNTAIYTAALKIGSTLGAARTTPGAGHAAAEWTDQAAEDALMEAAEANGYTGQHGAAAARTAIRSGLRNGLRQPRPLPDFTTGSTAQAPEGSTARARRRPGKQARDTGQAHAGPAARSREDRPGTGPGNPAPVPAASRCDAQAAETVSAVLAAAGYPASSHHSGTGWGEGFRLHPQPDGSVLVGHEAIAEDIGGVAARDRVHHMTGWYARTLQDAGYQVTSPAPGSLAVTPPPPGAQPRPIATPEQARQATRAAVAADEAYRTGEFDRARRLIAQAAGLDPSRAGLWDRHRAEITAKQLFTRAQAARTEGDHARADQLLAECREADPRLEAGWYRHLTGIRNGQLTRQPPSPAAEPMAGDDRHHGQGARQPAGERATGREPGPPWPSRPARSPNPQASGPGGAPAEPEPPRLSGPPAPPAQGGEPKQQRARHSWEPADEGTKRCTRDGCGLQATRRLHPTERRWLTTYTQGGRTIVADRVPACGQDLPHGAGTEEMRHLATEADRQAGLAFRTGDIDRAYRLLTDARALDPARQQLWDTRERQIRSHVAARQPRQVSHNTEKAPCPQCGESYVRPAGETCPCLSCESQARLKAAGFTAGSPEIKRVAEWNHAALRRAGCQQETPQPRPEAEPGREGGPQITADAGPVPGEAKDLDREREASG